jgi:hypothetical protein
MASPSTITAVTVAWSSGFVATITPKQAQELFVNEMNKHRGRGKRKLSGYKGVEWSRPLQAWTYRIQYKKQVSDDNPTFATEELAAKAYDAHKMRLAGIKAALPFLNFYPDTDVRIPRKKGRAA